MDITVIKRKLRYRFPVRILLNIKKSIENKWLAHERAKYLPKIREIVTHNTSIISSNCFAGRIMQDLGMQYNTPTLGLYFWYPDYIEFLTDLKHYLTEAKLEFVEHSKYTLGDERRKRWSHWYPIALLGGKVEIAFLHYHTEEEAAEKWYRRAKRVNWDRLLIIGMEQNLCSEKDIYAFDNLPYVHKIMFSSKNLPLESNAYMTEFTNRGEVGDPYKKGHLFYRMLIEKISKQ